MRLLDFLQRGLAMVFFSPLVILSCFVKKDNSIWVFGAWNGRQYSDNPRYLFETIDPDKEQVQRIWISKSEDVVRRVRQHGYRAYYWRSLKGIYYCLRAGAAVVSHSADDINPYASYKTSLFKITHGTPMKRMGVDDNASYPGRLARFFYHHLRVISPQRRSPLVAFVSSEISKSRFESAYRGSSIDVVNSGYPRWQGILSNRDVLWNTIKTLSGVHRGEKYDKVIMYAPTRRANKRFKLKIYKEFEEFVSQANEKGYFVILRPHPSLTIDMDAETQRELKGRGFIELDYKLLDDINSALQDVDVLLTDYSSIIYDYCILGRPAFLYAPDLEEYISSDTGLYAPYGVTEPAVMINRLNLALDSQTLAEATNKSNQFREIHVNGDASGVCARIVSEIKARI